MKIIKKIFITYFSFIFIILLFHINANAALVNTSDNTVFKQNIISSGTTGKEMNIVFTFTADKDYENAFIGLAYDEDINSTPEQQKADTNTYPFETSKDTFKRKAIGKIKMGQTRTVTLSAKVRKDIDEAYYSVLVYVSDSKEGGSKSEQEYINVWIKKAQVDKENKKDNPPVNFVLGSGQDSPSGKYPDIMNFTINLKNIGKATALDVVANMVLDKDPNVFPFEINEINYDRNFDKIEKDETKALEYSFAIRKDVYTGYYPIKLKIRYKESSNSEIKTDEMEFYVYIINKEKEEKESGDFNVNNRKKARLIVDSFYTIPQKVLAGEEFELILNMKNASSNIAANNILFSFEPEKVSDSPVFSIENGASSRVVNILNSLASTQLRIKMVSKPAIEQRSYNLKINEKFDSPEFKNAEESVSIDIPIYQVAKLKVGNFELAPSDISVGEDINITFPINNTGKVQLYNVSVKFEADYLKNNETYVGNIKPGETGNVDIMLTGIKESEGKEAKLIVTYENDSGDVSTYEKTLIIPVNEEKIEDEAIKDGQDENNNKIQKPRINKIINIIKIILVFSIIIAILIVILKRIKFKKKMV